MSIPQMDATHGARAVNGLNFQAAAQQRTHVASYNAAESTLVSLAGTKQDGVVGDFFSTVWSVMTWPVRTAYSLVCRAWNWMCGTSAAVAADAAEKTPAEEFGAAIKAKKFKAEDFRAAYANLPEDQQKAFKECYWVVSGHTYPGPGKEAADWVQEQVLDNKKYEKSFTGSVVQHFKGALALMNARDALKDMAERLGEDGLENCKDVKKECYEKLPNVVKEQVKQLATLFYTGAVPAAGTAHFNDGKKWIEANRRACQALSDGNFILLNDRFARREIEAMGRTLAAHHTRHGAVNAADITAHYNTLGEKAKTMLAQVVGCLVKVKDSGDAYLRGVYYDKDGNHVAMNVNAVVHAVAGIEAFDHRA